MQCMTCFSGIGNILEIYRCLCGKVSFCNECVMPKNLATCEVCHGPERLITCSEIECKRKAKEYFSQKEVCSFCYKTNRCLHSLLLRSLNKDSRDVHYCMYPKCERWICLSCEKSSMCTIVKEYRCLEHHSGVALWFSKIEETKRSRPVDTDSDGV